MDKQLRPLLDLYDRASEHSDDAVAWSAFADAYDAELGRLSRRERRRLHMKVETRLARRDSEPMPSDTVLMADGAGG